MNITSSADDASVEPKRLVVITAGTGNPSSTRQLEGV
jgi:hypothetical protein